jgi:metal-responsive CopG/Arc/MetJ family transcriptional regulator
MTVSLPPELYKKAAGFAKKKACSKSELVRAALRNYVARKEHVLGLKRQLAKNLRKKGIRTPGDVERIIDAGRA